MNMSIATIKTVVCDVCNDTFDVITTLASEARKEAHKAGWKTIRGNDICFDCMNDKKEGAVLGVK